MSMRLRDLIRLVRASRTAAEERATIRKELAAIRTAFKKEDDPNRHRNVAKLLYCHMMGYPTHFGQMECLKLIASPRFTEKRIGYLGLMVMLDEKQEVLMLVTNSLKIDLNHPNQFVAGLALAALGNIGSVEMCRDLAPEVEKLLGATNPYIRKKAALVAVRIIRKVPDVLENFLHRVRGLLVDRNHAVLLSSVTMLIEMCVINPSKIDVFRRLVPNLIRLLKGLVQSGYAPEHDVAGVTDPFLQVKVLRLLAYLGHGSRDASDLMNDVLAQVATNTETTKNVGNAILYECVKTIMTIEAETGLRVLAINILGRFLVNRDNNIRYVALNTLSKVLKADLKAVQRHRDTIVECLRDHDISIRRRALDLVYALVNEDNVRVLVRELLNYLLVADVEFKSDLARKICTVIDRYAPNNRWRIEQFLRVLNLAGDYVPEDNIASFTISILQDIDFQPYAIRLIYSSLKNVSQNSLIRVAAWCVGEFGELLLTPPPAPTGDWADALALESQSKKGEGEGEDVVDMKEVVKEEDIVNRLEIALNRCSENEKSSNNSHNHDDNRMDSAATTVSYILTSLAKLSVRFSSSSSSVQEKIEKLLKIHETSVHIELQQRSVEYSTLLNLASIKSGLLERMPPLEDEELKKREQRLLTAEEAGMESFGRLGIVEVEEGSGLSGGMSIGSVVVNPKVEPKPDEKGKKEKEKEKEKEKKEKEKEKEKKEKEKEKERVQEKQADLLDLDLMSVGVTSTPPTVGGVGAGVNTNIDLLADLMGGSGSGDLNQSSGVGIGVGAVQGSSLLDLLQDTPQQPTTANTNTAGYGDFMSSPAPAPVQSPIAVSSPPEFIAFDKGGLQIIFDFMKQPKSPQLTQITATFKNRTQEVMSGVLFQAAVPKYVKLQMLPASSSDVPPVTSGLPSVTQILRLNNTLHGQKPIQMRVRVEYRLASAPSTALVEQAEVSKFPEGI